MRAVPQYETSVGNEPLAGSYVARGTSRRRSAARRARYLSGPVGCARMAHEKGVKAA